MSRDAEIIPFRDANAEMPKALSLGDVTLCHRGSKLLDRASATVSAKGVTGLIGPNGAGKSVLLRVVMGLIAPTNGTVAIHDDYKTTALVFQRPILLRRSVRGNLLHALKIAGVPRSERTGKLAELLVAGDLTRLAESPARSLSGGEQQRLAIVRALASDPQLILLDEPTASLDPTATHAIENLIKATAARGVKILIVTHDRSQATRLCDDILFLHKGHIAEHTDAKKFFKSPTTSAAQAYLSGELLL